MPVTTKELFVELAATCTAQSELIATELGEALGIGAGVKQGAVCPWDSPQQISAVAGPGLLLNLSRGETRLALALAQASGLLPEQAADGQAAAAAKWNGLAQRLAELLLPPETGGAQGMAGWCEDLAGSLRAARPAGDALILPLEIIPTAGKPAPMLLVGPLADAASAADHPSIERDFEEQAAATSAALPNLAAIAALPNEAIDLAALPGYTRSLLRIRLPVMVTLARKRQPSARIIELAPGSIIQFSKPCDEMLDLEVAGHEVAKGECVKVGDKFGLRVTSITLPPERFNNVR